MTRRVRFTPVTSLVKNYPMHWQKDSEWYYDTIFVNPFITGRDATREDFPDAKLIVADSGGYQIKTGKLDPRKVDQASVLNWQQRIADLGMTLDEVPFRFEDGPKVYLPEFRKSLSKSVANANYAYEHVWNEKFKLYAILQGTKKPLLEEWYNAITKEHQFDGYALPVAKVYSPKQLEDLFGQMRFIKSLDKPIHFLGRCQPIYILIYTKLADELNMNITFDSSTAVNGVKFGQYLDPRTLQKINFTWKPYFRVNWKDNDLPPCNCPYCSNYTIKEMRAVPHRIMNHNVYAIDSKNRHLETIVKDDDMFERALEIESFHFNQYKNKGRKKMIQDIKDLVYD